MTALPSSLRPTLRLRPRSLLVASLVVVALAQVGASLGGAPVTIRPPAPVAGLPGPIEVAGGPSASTAADLRQINSSIGLWTANLDRNAADFLSATNLGLLYDARARLTGDVADHARSLTALDRALAIEPAHLPARLLHARGLLATHDFGGALAEARAIAADVPGEIHALATIGDASLELGDVATAQTTYAELARLAPSAPVTARLARLAFLRGDTEGARMLAARAIDESAAAGERGPASSWYAYLAGTLAIAGGAPADALVWFDRAIADWPESQLGLAGRGRALAALGRTDEAIASYEAAVAVSPQLESVAALGDLYALRGDEIAATRQYDTVELIGRLGKVSEQVYSRALALFWLDHGRQPAEALAAAEAELETRRDVYGWDVYGWALLSNGRAAEADAAMTQALSLGTRDARLFFHAGMAAGAVGDVERARGLLTQSLALEGALDPLSAARAAAALEELR